MMGYLVWERLIFIFVGNLLWLSPLGRRAIYFEDDVLFLLINLKLQF